MGRGREDCHPTGRPCAQPERARAAVCWLVITLDGLGTWPVGCWPFDPCPRPCNSGAVLTPSPPLDTFVPGVSSAQDTVPWGASRAVCGHHNYGPSH